MEPINIKNYKYVLPEKPFVTLGDNLRVPLR
jgi:hypothetical protein